MVFPVLPSEDRLHEAHDPPSTPTIAGGFRPPFPMPVSPGLRADRMVTALIAMVTSVAGAAAVPPDHAARMQAGAELFRETVGAALDTHCLRCHGGEKTRAGFSLATRDALLAGGHSGPAVDLEHPEASLLLALLRHEEEPFMPAKKPPLDAVVIDAIARWIELGAAYDRPLVEPGTPGSAPGAPLTVTETDRAFWSFRPLEVASPPVIANDDWSRNAIDRFVLARQREAGLHPNGPADRRVLARRAALDLTGLPPEPADLDRFLADEAPDAWERFVDRLLASPRYGERWARHWIDVARFAESSGFEHDYDRPNAYHYRDFLVRAFNEDLPWDRFVSWQLAGDELAPEDPLALMATGFLAAGVFPTQLTEAEFERARYDELDDMVSTAGVAFLGLSVGCARCHDHKYDPVPMSDYYRMTAAFATTIRSEIPVEIDSDGHREAVAAWQAEDDVLAADLAARQREVVEPAFAAWLADPSSGDRELPPAEPWNVLALEGVSSREGAAFTLQPDGSFLAGGANPGSDEYVSEAAIPPGGLRAVRLEALTDQSLPQQGPGRAANGNFALSDLRIEFLAGQGAPGDAPAQPQPVTISGAATTHQQNTGSLSVAASLDDDRDRTGWAVDAGGIGRDQAAVFRLAGPLEGPGRLRITLRFHVNHQHALGRFRVSGSADPDAPVAVGGGSETALAEAADMIRSGLGDALDGDQRAAALRWFAGSDAEWRRLDEALRAHRAARPEPEHQTVLVCSEDVPPISHHADGRGYPHFYPEVHFLNRGDPGQKGDVATPGFLQVLMPAGESGDQWRREPPAPGGGPSFRRASLAGWLTDTDHGAGALLARVAVNRAWQHHFGTGIVATPNDFGQQGERPSHPELLDWLADDFIRHGWSLKHLHRTILASATYRQDSASDEERSRIDIDNRLLWRFAPRRLEAEAIRDSLLAVSGLLDERPFGPGTLDPAMRRRSLYFTIKRSRLPNVMLVFDWPEHLVSIGRRATTTIAPQALYFMNSPEARGFAEGLAERARTAASPRPDGPLEAAYRLALGRAPGDGETAAARAFLEAQAATYRESGSTTISGDEASRLAFVDLCQALLGSNEFLHLP